ncbi:protein-disulfide reductase DsbD [Shewanella cyperi]|uniref:Thiol:disulfide interchange protein DsbD n=1 Tax=Shewanella cyperi TaxID=2814292 RepID=A0A974XLT3_9GAMM|nr:protein-disulfide reductase DsbD [Shewanella cyperi]QSX29623.1 protein-disulfide reductase DsbD [Shewanella cyperi]QSX40404.1 protein-disulfide reductase DsbD [Shewanella cyperi]
MNKFTTLLSSLLLVLLSHTSLAANGFDFLKDEPELMPVDQAFVFDFEQQGSVLKISWVIADGYYLYRDKLKFSADQATLGEIGLPTGKPHVDDYFGEQQVYYSYVEVPVALKSALDTGSVSVTFMGCAEDKLCYPPTTRTALLSAVADNDGQLPKSDVQGNAQDSGTTEAAVTKAPVTEQDRLSRMLAGSNLLWTLLIFFGLGVGLALTPCVFPMYPILSGIIVGQGKQLSTARAFSLSMVYVQGMAITYSLLGLVVASAGMKYQAALQHPAVLVVLALLFAVLSLSMFGLYELRLPSAWQQKLNSASSSQKGGKLTGVFLMGVISGLVASPCTTAPLSGALIYVAQSGDLLLGFLALYVLSMGMGLPLLLIGTSGGKLLPKAGAWMDLIKTLFGFLLLAVSIIMLGRIWTGLLSDLLWSIWGISMIAYLMHQNKQTQFNWKQTVRSVILLLALLTSFSYGFHAVMGALGFSMPRAVSPVNGILNQGEAHEFKRFKTLAELNTELAAAKAAGKPVMVDLYADWCVACKEFEAITFKDGAVKERMNTMVLLQADVTRSDDEDVALLEAYDVLGLPTLLMFDAKGVSRDDLRVTGFMAPAEFADHLDLLLKQ